MIFDAIIITNNRVIIFYFFRKLIVSPKFLWYIIPQELIDDSSKLEIYMMIDNLANKIKDKTNKEFKAEFIKKIINNMMTLLD
jgi:hypothetical protein